MLKKKSIGIVVGCSLFVSCTSVVDTTIPLSKAFKEDTSLIVLKTPNWKLKDSVYDKQLGNYLISNSKTTRQRLNENLTGVKREGGFLNYLLFGDRLHYIVSEFDVEGKQRFSFELKRDGVIKATSKCEMFSKSLRTDSDSRGVIRFGRGNNVNESFTNREKSFLVCSINTSNQHWGLTLKSYRNEPLIVKLSSTNSSYTIKEVSQRHDVLSNGETRNSPPWISLHSGLKF